MINGRTLADIVDELDENANSRDPLQVNFRNFSDLRAYAAAIALSTRFWADAEQYAKAARELASSATATHELDFLVCVTSRYSIADRFSTDKANGIDGFQRHWEEFDKLTRVLKQIKTKIGLRFNSETAAIRIFKSEAMLVSGDYQGAALALRKALKDIYFCLDEIYANGDHHHSVVDQVTHNYASAFILATLIKSSDSSAVFNGFTSRRTTYVADYFLRPKRRKLSAFLNLEKELFRVLVGAPCESSESVVSYLKKSMTEEKNLGMDSLLCNMIEHRISSVGIAGIMEASKTIVSK
jgi:DNA mismatch repair ATPase MutS